MRRIATALLVTLFMTVLVVQNAQAQAPTLAQAAAQPAPTKTFASSADVAALLAKAKATRKEGQANLVQPILSLAPYSTNLEYRASVGNATVHEKEAELFLVLDGSATMITGGKLVNEKRTNEENLAGDAIEGGVTRNIAKGDFIMVPENTPHWFSVISQTLVLMSMHVPRPFPAH